VRVLEPDDLTTYWTRINLAFIVARQNRYDEGETMLREILEINPAQAAQTTFFLACVRGLRGDVAGALARLREAAERGYSDAEELAGSEELVALRGHPDYEAIVAALRAKRSG
jgi:hypothetical protein